MNPLSDPEGLRCNKERLTKKLAGLKPGTQEHRRVKLHLEGVEKELKEVEAAEAAGEQENSEASKGLPDSESGLPAGIPAAPSK